MSAWPLTWSVATWCSVPRPIPGDRVASAVAKRHSNFRALVAEGRPSEVGSSRYPERINAVTVDDIQQVAEDHLRPANLSIVLVGDASTFVRDLPGVGFDRFEVIPLAELDLSTTDLRLAR